MQDVACRRVPQHLHLAFDHPAKAEAVSDLVHIASGPRKAVGRGAIEIEDHQLDRVRIKSAARAIHALSE